MALVRGEKIVRTEENGLDSHTPPQLNAPTVGNHLTHMIWDKASKKELMPACVEQNDTA